MLDSVRMRDRPSWAEGNKFLMNGNSNLSIHEQFETWINALPDDHFIKRYVETFFPCSEAAQAFQTAGAVMSLVAALQNRVGDAYRNLRTSAESLRLYLRPQQCCKKDHGDEYLPGKYPFFAGSHKHH